MLEFYKYHGTGNDFIVIDNRNKVFDITDAKKIKLLCDRHFGVGADGVLLLENEEGFDFKMVYANSDGSLGAMCGNGGRCIVHFANHVLKIIKDGEDVKFLAADGAHHARIKGDIVELEMQNVKEVKEKDGTCSLHSGTTPHKVIFVKDLGKYPVFVEGKRIRGNENTNVNFVEFKNGIFHVRTYERGVEDETLACGTGAASVAIAAHHLGTLKEEICHIKMPGGDLTVKFKKNKEGIYQNVWLIGPAVSVFKGEF